MFHSALKEFADSNSQTATQIREQNISETGGRKQLNMKWNVTESRGRGKQAESKGKGDRDFR